MEIQVMAEGKKEMEQPDDYQIKCWADTLLEAEEIKNDPEKMALVKPLLQKKAKAIRSIADLKSIAKEKISKAQQDSDQED